MHDRQQKMVSWLALVLLACSSPPAHVALAEVSAEEVDLADADDAADLATTDAVSDDVSADLAADLVDDTALTEVAPGDAVAEVADVAADMAADVVSCTPGSQTCEGIKLATCLGDGNGYSVSTCFPGTACSGGACKPVGANLIIAFDTSGSMSSDVQANGQNLCSGGYSTWPMCEYDATKFPLGCTRIGVSKKVFQKALAKLDDQVTHLALFKFPQTLTSFSGTSCDSGAYTGQDTISNDNDSQDILLTTNWYWSGLNEILAVPYPKIAGFDSKSAISKWMDGSENQNSSPIDPELRADGGTPIGKTLFYIGEYLRNRVIVDGKTCTDDASCGSVNYICQNSVCVDPARSCRDTVVVLFTDGGESSTLDYFGPWIQAKRMSIGLGCQTSADCAGGATCQNVGQCSATGSGWVGSTEYVDDKPCGSDKDCGSGGKCKSYQECVAKPDPSGLPYFCSEGGNVCDPLVSAHCASTDPEKKCSLDTSAPLYCSAYCVRDPRPGVFPTPLPKSASDNVLRSPDGKPFGVRLFVVDIGSSTGADIMNSWRLAMSGGGRLLGVNAGDPAAFLGALDKAFDLKNKKACGITQ